MKSLVSMRRPLARPRGFTLIELLVVISIIVLLMALAIPSFIGTIQSNRLSAAGQNLLGRLSQAQQTASSTNMPVEVRFYKYTDPSVVGQDNQGYFGAYQFLTVKTSLDARGLATEKLEPLSAPFFTESGVYISGGNINGSPASPLLTGSGATPFQDDGGANSGIAKQIKKSSDSTASFIPIRLYPDGTVKRLGAGNDTSMSGVTVRQLQALALTDAYLTLVGEKDLKGTDIVPNYYAVQLDPYTGHARSYQPRVGP